MVPRTRPPLWSPSPCRSGQGKMVPCTDIPGYLTILNLRTIALDMNYSTLGRGSEDQTQIPHPLCFASSVKVCRRNEWNAPQEPEKQVYRNSEVRRSDARRFVASRGATRSGIAAPLWHIWLPAAPLRQLASSYCTSMHATTQVESRDASHACMVNPESSTR